MKYGRYRVTKLLGRGSMGVVYLAHDPQIERSIALKVLREDRLSSADFVQRFLDEARAIGRLSHPGIVTVYDVGQDQGTIYIAMEFVAGKPLNEIITQTRLDLPEIVKIAIQVAEILQYAHARGIVHRDIKPSNLMVDSCGLIKITDFGIAHIEDASRAQQTQDGEILGTPAYMSPEQVMGQPVDGRSDLFSLGVVLYELSTGERPFKGKSIGTIMRSITEDSPPEPVKISPLITRELSRIIMKCLSKSPADRFASGAELADALRSCRLEDQSAVQRHSWSAVRRRRSLFLALTLIISLSALSASAVYLYRSNWLSSNGVLSLESKPTGAQVFVDGALQGKTPVRLDLTPGKHEVRLEHQNYYDWAAQVLLKKEKRSLHVELLPIE